MGGDYAMIELKRVSRWISIDCIEVTPKHRLYCYGDKYGEEKGKRSVLVFRHGGKLYALGQFLRTCSSTEWNKYEYRNEPVLISGYDSENWYKPLLLEIDDGNGKVRLYNE